jgi:hypothetical protein
MATSVVTYFVGKNRQQAKIAQGSIQAKTEFTRGCAKNDNFSRQPITLKEHPYIPLWNIRFEPMPVSYENEIDINF